MVVALVPECVLVGTGKVSVSCEFDDYKFAVCMYEFLTEHKASTFSAAQATTIAIRMTPEKIISL